MTLVLPPGGGGCHPLLTACVQLTRAHCTSSSLSAPSSGATLLGACGCCCRCRCRGQGDPSGDAACLPLLPGVPCCCCCMLPACGVVAGGCAGVRCPASAGACQPLSAAAAAAAANVVSAAAGEPAPRSMSGDGKLLVLLSSSPSPAVPGLSCGSGCAGWRCTVACTTRTASPPYSAIARLLTPLPPLLLSRQPTVVQLPHAPRGMRKWYGLKGACG